MPVTYADVYQIAHDPERFPSRAGVTVIPPTDATGKPTAPFGIPPINSDPPLHTWTRRIVLSWLGPHRTVQYEPLVRDYCNSLIDGFIDIGQVDIASEYAQKIPVFVIAQILGVPADLGETFTSWVRDVLEFAHEPERRQRGIMGVVGYFQQAVADRLDNPKDDFVSELANYRNDGEPLEKHLVIGMSCLMLIAGIDTTWSAIGSALWHLASHPDDLRRLVNEPDLIDTAVEELLRAYTPVTVARTLVNDVEFNGCPMKAGERVILNFAAANRDPEVFEDPNSVLLDRQMNRHIAFGTGIHRCAGSNLARMEMRVAIQTLISRIQTFNLSDPGSVKWAGGQIRGPREVLIRY